MTMTGAVTWFEIGTPDPDGAQRFYGGLFGWTAEGDASTTMDYRQVTTGDGHPVGGGIFATGGNVPSYAVFCVQVGDVAATCRRAEELGGKVLVAPVTIETGLIFAHLLDLDGNHFEIYSPAPK
jgi:predicted enzyme related to lactoylglutathione lyase